MPEVPISKSCYYQSVKLFAHCANINLGQAEIIWEYDGNVRVLLKMIVVMMKAIMAVARIL